LRNSVCFVVSRGDLICDFKSEPTAGVIYNCKNKNWFMMSMADYTKLEN
jgi:hypothetical protein